MLELGVNRKNKVHLSDYNCQQDIENRSLLADLSFFEHEVLQEIFFSPLKFSLKKLSRSLNCQEAALSPLLDKLAKSTLLSIQGDTVLVDKEMRKYFEFHMKRFDLDFKPDMEYLQGILRKVPIHLLPNWYAIPRTSNNIFESLVEKYLLTPQYFQRYLSELSFVNPIAHRILQDVFSAPDFKITSSDLITKYNLKRQEFEEILLILEFSFVCCVTYTKGEDLWTEWVTPFHEWHEYLRFLKTTEVFSIPAAKEIVRKAKADFAFIEELSQSFSSFLVPFEKKDLLQLLDQKTIEEFLSLNLEKRALYLYRHPLIKSLDAPLFKEMISEKNVREAEKSIRRVLKKQWVFFDEFIKGAIVCLNDDSLISLKKVGKSWKYTLPSYSEKELSFIQLVVLEWLFEVGMVAPGICDGRDCFSVTPFGRFFFEE